LERGHREIHPNDLLYYDTLHWACLKGFKHCDCGSINKGIARKVMSGEGLSEREKKSRDVFHLRFGGAPKWLPPARLYFPNGVYRFVYGRILVRLGGVPIVSHFFR
jgi:hypothetical protein